MRWPAGFGQGVDLAVEILVAPAGAGVADQVSSGGGGSEQVGFGFDGTQRNSTGPGGDGILGVRGPARRGRLLRPRRLLVTPP